MIWEALKHVQSAPPLKSPKNPWVAFICGFFFGPIGVGVYLESKADFFALLAIVIIASLGTAGLAAPVAWMFCGVWGAKRAAASNTIDGPS